jgi:hypothetical protein
LVDRWEQYSVTLAQFSSILGLKAYFKRDKKLHDECVLGLPKMNFMYESSVKPHPLTIPSFLPFFLVFHRLVWKTLAPREGDSSRVPQYERNFMQYIRGNEQFNAFDLIF